MWLASLRRLIAAKSPSRQIKHGRPQRRIIPRLDQLEDRTLLTGGLPYATPSTCAQLIADISSANSAGGAVTITLATGSTFDFTTAYPSTINALPVVSGTITIKGNNDTLQRDGSSPFSFRLFQVASGASLTLENLTLKGGMVSGSAAKGGAVYNSGNLKMTSCHVSGNAAVAGNGQNGEGGGIYASGGSLTLTNSLVNVNSVYGGSGAIGTPNHATGGAGGNAQGGGIYANATTVTISGGGVSYNVAQPGNGGRGASGTSLHPIGGAGGASGMGQGGGVYVQGGSLTISNAASVTLNTVDTFTSAGGPGGTGYNSNGIYGAGGAGGKGSVQEGGNVSASRATVSAPGNAMINEGEVYGAYGGAGGAGGKSKAGGQGGDAGLAAGGGLYIANGGVTLGTGVGVNASTVLPGWGGNGGSGGSGGNGGAGGTAEGGGLCASNSTVTLSNGTGILNAPTVTTLGINNSTLGTTGSGRGGNGGTATGTGTAGIGGNGGAGGQAQGGGVFASGSNLAISLGTATLGATVNDNSLTGGAGGSGGLGHKANGVGGAGALGAGGGLAILGDKLTLTNATIASNSAGGGGGGDGASTTHGVISNFGNGGGAQGGGLYVVNSGSVSVFNSTFADDEATASTGTSGGVAAPNGTAKYGLGGTALGGGVYANFSTVNVLNSTFAINLLAAGTNVGTSASAAHVTGGGTAQGGGLYSANGTLSLINDTIAWNYLVSYTNRGAVLGQGGGLFNGPSSTLSLENTIVALDLMFANSQYGENNANGTYNDFASASTATLAVNDANLIGGVGGIADTNLAPGGSEQLFAPALFSNNLGKATLSGQVPGSYGGLTDTLPLAWGNNPALSNGDATAAGTIATDENGSSASASNATDQRGSPRVIDGTIDIGATQTQVILNGSRSATTVQGGGTITYTLTVTNNESTTASVTLTDVLDSNTTYQSSSGANWTITPPTSSSGGTLTAAISLAANAKATLTITVGVASNVPGNTTLVNTASIAPTGNSAAGARSVMLDTQTQGATNITKEVGVVRSPVLRDRDDGPNAYVQGALLFNWSGVTLTGPIALVLVGLPSDVTLTNASGYYNGSPYINIVPANGSWLAGWWNFLITVLEFSTTNPADIKYTPEILQGI